MGEERKKAAASLMSFSRLRNPVYKLKNRGTFQIWTADTLRQYGFSPTHAPYYVVLFFNSKNPIKIIHQPNLKEGSFTYKAKIRPLSDFIGIK